jgi:hypothetical protein
MLKLFSFICIFLYSISLNAQNLDKWHDGSAIELNGNIYILAVFITTPKKKWTYDEKTDLIASQLKAQEWLKNKAKLYGTDISFENGFYGLKSDIFVDEIKSIKEVYEARLDWVYSILTKIGYSSPLEFLEKLKNTKQCSNALVIIYANESGRPYAVPYSTGWNKEKYFFEGCMIYGKSKNYPPCAATIAHEILHLFGAWDLYRLDKKDKERARKAKDLYPDDIMLEGGCDLETLKISRLTAWLVGICKKKEDVFEELRPANHPNE